MVKLKWDVCLTFDYSMNKRVYTRLFLFNPIIIAKFRMSLFFVWKTNTRTKSRCASRVDYSRIKRCTPYHHECKTRWQSSPCDDARQHSRLCFMCFFAKKQTNSHFVSHFFIETITSYNIYTNNPTKVLIKLLTVWLFTW